jgi:membrane-associated phospholipid phosphatase
VAVGDAAAFGAGMTTIRLPVVIRRAATPLPYLLYWAPFIAAYQLTNRFPAVAPGELPFTALDRLLPFVPALLPVYVAYIPLYWWTVWRSANDREVNRLFYAAYLQLLLCLPFFVLWPVRMPRERFYPPEAFGIADAFWRWFDEPNNCFPSLHAATCLLLMQFNWPRPHRWPVAVLTAGILASTVLVKQHYVVDLLGGAAVYVVSRWFLQHLEITGLTADGWDLRRLEYGRVSPTTDDRRLTTDD